MTIDNDRLPAILIYGASSTIITIYDKDYNVYLDEFSNEVYAPDDTEQPTGIIYFDELHEKFPERFI